ncbi:MAG TPA: response regulator transcription factor [Hyphomicrobiaceae bacterium]|nr:response regulator transcription factor [Hyphomicrobiaceae bacterium]
MPDCVRIAIIDRHPIFRRGLVDTVSSDRMTVVAEGETVDDAMAIVSAGNVDLLVLGVSISRDAIDAAEHAMRAQKKLKVVILTDSDDEADAVEAIRAGVQGYILKGVTGPELLNALDLIVADTSYITPSLASRLLMMTGKPVLADGAGDIDLSHRDRRVLRHLAKGLSNEQLALELGVTVRTTKYYLSQIFRKLRVRSRVEAMVKAQSMRLH